MHQRWQDAHAVRARRNGDGDQGGVQFLRFGQKRWITTTLHAMVKRRSAIEAMIGPMKTEGRLGRVRLRGAENDVLTIVLCAAGRAVRVLLLRRFVPDPFHGGSMPFRVGRDMPT